MFWSHMHVTFSSGDFPPETETFPGRKTPFSALCPTFLSNWYPGPERRNSAIPSTFPFSWCGAAWNWMKKWHLAACSSLSPELPFRAGVDKPPLPPPAHNEARRAIFAIVALIQQMSFSGVNRGLFCSCSHPHALFWLWSWFRSRDGCCAKVVLCLPSSQIGPKHPFRWDLLILPARHLAWRAPKSLDLQIHSAWVSATHTRRNLPLLAGARGNSCSLRSMRFHTWFPFPWQTHTFRTALS